MALNQAEKQRLDNIETKLDELSQLLIDASAADKTEGGASLRVAQVVESVASFSKSAQEQIDTLKETAEGSLQAMADRIDELGPPEGGEDAPREARDIEGMVEALALVVAHLNRSAFAPNDDRTRAASAYIKRVISDRIVAAAVVVKETKVALVDTFELARAVKDLRDTVEQLEDIEEHTPATGNALQQARASLELYEEKLEAAEAAASV